jgi:hypothetical protein
LQQALLMIVMANETQGRDTEEGTRVIPPVDLDFDAVIARSQAACSDRSDDDDGLKREVLAYAGNRWSMVLAWPALCATLSSHDGSTELRSVC